MKLAQLIPILELTLEEETDDIVLIEIDGDNVHMEFYDYLGQLMEADMSVK